MPAVVVKGALVVATLLAAAAVAVYESPEVRQFAEDCRRRIAIALHSLGDDINPASGTTSQPRFNRPEDAEGFMRSSTEAGVDADEDSRRRQREELMYWNQVRLEKLSRDGKKVQEEDERETQGQTHNSTFDGFLHQDPTAERGTFVYNTGTDVHDDMARSVRRRGEGVHGLDRGAAFANPFANDQVEIIEQESMDASLMQPEPSEMSDIYSAEDRKRSPRAVSDSVPHQDQLVDTSEHRVPETAVSEAPSPFEERLYTSGVEAHPDSAFASIHAWADVSTNSSFYTSFPISPSAPASEASRPGEGDDQLTPTDSMSLAGSGEDVGLDNASSINGDGISTPGSWTEVGSVVSEASNVGPHH